MCKCNVYVTHIIEIKTFKEQNSAPQWYLWIITGGFLGSKLGRTQLDLIKMICLLQHYQHCRSVIGRLKSLMAFPQIGNRNGCILTILLEGNQGKRYIYIFLTIQVWFSFESQAKNSSRSPFPNVFDELKQAQWVLFTIMLLLLGVKHTAKHKVWHQRCDKRHLALICSSTSSEIRQITKNDS